MFFVCDLLRFSVFVTKRLCEVTEIKDRVTIPQLVVIIPHRFIKTGSKKQKERLKGKPLSEFQFRPR